MSAQILLFPKAQLVSSDDLMEADRAPGFPLPFGAGSDDLNAEDIRAIEDNMPTLRGFWILEFLEDDGECLSAVLHKSSGWEAFRRIVVVQRTGTKLSVSMRSHEGQEHLGEFESAVLAMKAIGATVGLGSRLTWLLPEVLEEVRSESSSEMNDQ